MDQLYAQSKITLALCGKIEGAKPVVGETSLNRSGKFSPTYVLDFTKLLYVKVVLGHLALLCHIGFKTSIIYLLPSNVVVIIHI